MSLLVKGNRPSVFLVAPLSHECGNRLWENVCRAGSPLQWLHLAPHCPRCPWETQLAHIPSMGDRFQLFTCVTLTLLNGCLRIHAGLPSFPYHRYETVALSYIVSRRMITMYIHTIPIHLYIHISHDEKASSPMEAPFETWDSAFYAWCHHLTNTLLPGFLQLASCKTPRTSPSGLSIPLIL
jgi:hypothetical protein